MLPLFACATPEIDLGADTPAASDSLPPEIEPPPDTEVELLPGDTAPDPVEPDAEALYESLFDPTVVQTVELELSDLAIQHLNNDGLSGYVQGNVVINGTRLDEVGVRLKGSSTYQDLDCDDGYCKAAFKIKLDELIDGQKYAGLKRVTLNNMSYDYTQAKEVVVYDLLHRQSQLAPRASFAWVTLNGEPMGLYANVESMDDEWLERRFADPTGNLWGTTNGGIADFSDTGVAAGWVLKSGDGDKSQLTAVIEALDRFGGDFFAELGPVVNAEQWLDYWAWCAAVGNYDGYPFHLNDVLIYGDPADDNRFVFVPWGTDESWDLYESTGQTWNVVYGRLAGACLADPACVAELQARIGETTAAYDEMDVMEITRAAWELSQPWVLEDPRRPYTPADVFYYRDYYETVIPGYGAYVRAIVGLD